MAGVNDKGSRGLRVGLPIKKESTSGAEPSQVTSTTRPADIFKMLKVAVSWDEFIHFFFHTQNSFRLGADREATGSF